MSAADLELASLLAALRSAIAGSSATLSEARRQLLVEAADTLARAVIFTKPSLNEDVATAAYHGSARIDHGLAEQRAEPYQVGTMDTLAKVKVLESGGLNREQAEAVVEVLHDAMREELATKRDLADLEGRLSRQMTELATRIDSKLDVMRAQISSEITREINGLRTEQQKELNGLRGEFQKEFNSIHVRLRVLEIAAFALLMRAYWEPLTQILGWVTGQK